MTVVKGKDILKTGIKISIFCILLFCMQKLFDSAPKEQIKLDELLDSSKLIGCLEDTIPIMKQINSIDKVNFEEKVERINPLKLIVGIQLEAIKNRKAKEKVKEEEEEITQKNVQMQVEQAQTGLTTKVEESNVPNKFTNSYNGVEVKNETDYMCDKWGKNLLKDKYYNDNFSDEYAFRLDKKKDGV